MCGIAGFISTHPITDGLQMLQKMAYILRHRGMDGEGVWQSEDTKAGMAHRRLAILDISDAAGQPMHYLHYSIVFNGEIYNYIELKHTLVSKGYQFKTHGDTEVIIAAFDHWGTNFLQQLDGMFALAIYSSKTKNLLLARDRFGEKPLYYHTNTASDSTLFFASEMKALWQANIPKLPDNQMVFNYLTLGYVQNPTTKSQTFFQHIFSLPPGNLLIFNQKTGKQTIEQWYRILPSASFKKQHKNDAVEQFYHLLLDSVRKRLRSDVAVGTSLSGGLDSSAIVACISALKKETNSKLANWSNVCFSAIFPEFEKNEIEFSKQVAAQFEINQFTTEPTAYGLIDDWQQLVYHQEEPFLSSSVYAQYKIFQLAKMQGITVLLDGQGADETLAGYKKYSHWFLQELLAKKKISTFYKEKKALQENELLEKWDIKNYGAAFLPKTTAKILAAKAAGLQTNNKYIHPDFLQEYGNRNTTIPKPIIRSLNDALYYNTFSMGLEELLRYADRNSMAHGREVRLPFLSHQLVEFIFTLPAELKIHSGFTKWILRSAMNNYLPENIVWRKNKVGFEPPQKQWMQHPNFIQMVNESKKQLVSNGILHSLALTKPVQPTTAYFSENFDWRFLSVAGVFSPPALNL